MPQQKSTNDSFAIERLVAGLEAAHQLFKEERALADERARAQRRLENSVQQLHSIISTGHRGSEPMVVQLAKLRNDITNLTAQLSELRDVSRASSAELDVMQQHVNKEIVSDHEARLRNIESWKLTNMGGQGVMGYVVTLVLSIVAIIATALQAIL